MPPTALAKKKGSYRTPLKDTKWGKDMIKRASNAAATSKKWKKKFEDSQVAPIATVACTVSGGAIAGLIEAKYPQIADTISTNLIVGTTGVMIGVFMPKAPMASQLLCISTGILTKWAGDLSEDLANGGAMSPMTLVGGATQ
jgi:ApbE superfamily uncharacterized protein (UPF0280 family)